MAHVAGSPIKGTIWLRDYAQQPILDATFAGDNDVLEAFDEDSTAAPLTITQINKTTKPGAYRWSFTPTTSGKVWTGHIVYDNNGVRREWSEDFRVVTAAQADPAAALSATVSAVDAINDRLTDARAAKLDRIGVGAVQVAAPVASSGRLTLRQGDDYTEELGNALQWSYDGPVDLTGATVALAITSRTVSLTVSCTVTNAGAATQTITAELTDEQTAQLKQSEVTSYAITAVIGGDDVTLLIGKVTVRV